MDLISRQAAIDAADRADYTGLAVEDVKKVTDEVVKELKQLPSVQERKGRWMRYGEDGYPNEKDTVVWQCDQCLTSYYGRTERIANYCPNCGAKMKEDTCDRGDGFAIWARSVADRYRARRE